MNAAPLALIENTAPPPPASRGLTTGQIKPRSHASTQACGLCRQNTPATNTPMSSPTSVTGGLCEGPVSRWRRLDSPSDGPQASARQPFHFRRRRRPHRAHQQSRFAQIEHIERPAFGQTFALTPFQRKHGLPFGRQSHRRGFHGSKIILPKATRRFDPRQNCPRATLLLPSSLVADFKFDFRHLETTNSRATIQMRGSTSNCQSGRQSNRRQES